MLYTHLTRNVSITWLEWKILNSHCKAPLNITNHVTISIVLDVARNHLVQWSEGGDVRVGFLVDDGDLERNILVFGLLDSDYILTLYYENKLNIRR